MDYEVALRRVFDFQHFKASQALSTLITETDKRLRIIPDGDELVDESLDIWAAGVTYPSPKPNDLTKHTTEDS